MRRSFALVLVLALFVSASAFAQEVDRIGLAQETIARIFAGDLEPVFEKFTPEMRSAVPLPALQAIPAQLRSAAGEFVSVESATLLGPTVTMHLHMQALNLIAQVSITDEGLIQGLGFMPQQQAEKAEEPLQFNEETIKIGRYKLPGVLTLPEGAAQGLPAAVLVHGSGPQDRDETIGDTKIFRDIAQGLSKQGIAVLRYDKRSYLMNRGEIPVTAEEAANMTAYDDTVEDALAAVEALKADPRIDPDRVFVVGHSQGAMLAPTIEQEGAGARGLVLLAGTLRPLAAVLADQLEALDSASFAEDILNARSIAGMTEEEARKITLIGSNGYFFWEQAQHDLAAIASACGAPMLILQGKDDAQVYADVDFALFEQFAKDHPDKDITLKLYEGLGHSFTVENAFSPEALGDIAAWILAR